MDLLQLTTLLADDGWSVETLDEPKTLRTMFQGDNGKWTCYAQVLEDRAQLVFYSYCPVTVPPAKRQIVGEFLHRANYGLILGNFEMMYETGEIRFRTSVDCEDSEPADSLLRPVVYVNVLMMDAYLPGIMAVAYGGMTPVDALGQIENEQVKQG